MTFFPSPIGANQWRVTVLLLAAGCASMGCHDNGYRTEVHAGSEGRYDIQRVPEDPATIQQRQAVAAVAADPDLAKLNTDWKKLSPKDQKTVLDLVERLSSGEH